MNKIVASLGLAAIGASTVQGVYADELGAPSSKIWSVSASLRGFYDDNINTVSDSAGKEESAGYEIRPGFGLDWKGDATSVNVNYMYGFRYYDHKPAGQSEKFDQNQTFAASVQHEFSPRYKIGVQDSFVIGQEPDALRTPNAPLAEVQRVSGDNMRNYGSIVFDAQFTPTWSLNAAYNNGYYNYADDFSTAANPPGSVVTPSNSGLMDRIEQNPVLESRWLLRPTTTGLIGYQFGVVSYTADEPISGTNGLPGLVMSDSRNSRSQYVYLGVIHTFNPDLSGSFRGGVQYIDFYDDTSDQTDLSPYIRASLTYKYGPDNHVDVGFSQSRSATDVSGSAANGGFTRDTDVSLVYGSLSHRITPRMMGSVIGTYQYAQYNGGSLDGETQQYFQIGLNLQYRFNSYLAADVGYNFDVVNSEVDGQDYTRNRVYVGLTGTY